MSKSFIHTKDTTNYRDYNIFKLLVAYSLLFPSLPTNSKSLKDQTESGFETERSLNNRMGLTVLQILHLYFVFVKLQVFTLSILPKLMPTYHLLKYSLLITSDQLVL